MGFQKFGKFIKGGKFLGLKEIGDSIVVKLACDPYDLEPKESKFKAGVQVFDFVFEDPESGEQKILTNGNMRFAQEIAKYEEGDLVKICLIEAKNGQKAYAARPPKGKVKEDEDDEDEEEPRKKKKSRDEDDEDDDSEDSDKDNDDDEESEDEDESDSDSDEDEESDEDDEDRPKKK